MFDTLSVLLQDVHANTDGHLARELRDKACNRGPQIRPAQGVVDDLRAEIVIADALCLYLHQMTFFVMVNCYTDDDMRLYINIAA